MARATTEAEIDSMNFLLGAGDVGGGTHISVITCWILPTPDAGAAKADTVDIAKASAVMKRSILRRFTVRE